jgi:competence protein ComEC
VAIPGAFAYAVIAGGTIPTQRALLMPFGLEGPALAMMGLGIDGVIAVAGMVSAWPGAVSLLPAMPIWGLTTIALGGLWLCLWIGPWRRWGGLAIVAGLSSLLLVRSPDVLIDGAGRLLAVRGADGRLTLSSTRAAKFVRASWLRRGGQDATPAEDWPRGETSRDGRLTCDGLGCFYRAKGRIVALAMRADAQAEDCWSAINLIKLKGLTQITEFWGYYGTYAQEPT